MASQDLKQRPAAAEVAASGSVVGDTTTSAPHNPSVRIRRANKLAMAKRGLRSLAVAIVIPLALTIIAAYVSGCPAASGSGSKPFWHPPTWAIHLASLSTSVLMGLSAWLVWAEGGFHRHPAALPLYVAQMVLALSWAPLVLGMGATRTGLAVAVALIGVLFGCSQYFKRVNPIAGDLVKPCLAWVSFLALLNYKLV